MQASLAKLKPKGIFQNCAAIPEKIREKYFQNEGEKEDFSIQVSKGNFY